GILLLNRTAYLIFRSGTHNGHLSLLRPTAQGTANLYSGVDISTKFPNRIKERSPSACLPSVSANYASAHRFNRIIYPKQGIFQYLRPPQIDISEILAIIKREFTA